MILLSRFLAISLAISVLGQELFSNRRKDFDAFVSYAPETRQYVADSIERMFGIYPTLDSKLANYGPRADYRPVLRDLVANAKNYTDREFHLKMAKMFSSLRDFHAIYFMPYPHGCVDVIVPIRFGLSKTDDQINNARPAVFSIGSDDELALTPEARQIQIGDILEKIDGMSFKEFFEMVQDDQNGANLSGGYRSAAFYLTNRLGYAHAFPEADNITFSLARYDLAGKLVTRYTATLPWLIEIVQDCESTIDWPNHPPLQVQQIDTSARVLTDEKTKKTLLTPVMENKQFRNQLPYGDQIPFNRSNSILGWTKYRSESCNVGIIRLYSFNPGEAVYRNTDEFIYFVQSLLSNELADTDGLIIDVTGNPGGFVFIADMLPQLFLRRGQISTGAFRGIVTPVNTDFIVNRKTFGNDKYYQAYVKALQNGDKYTDPVPLTSQEDANRLGTAYIKPVVVYNNGNCYSACDMFNAQMQDNDLAFIIGADRETGGGGAVVYTLSNLAGSGFPGLDVLGTGQDATIGHRQFVRVLKNAGELLEDRGVVADRGNVKLSIRDILDDVGPVFENLDQIAGYLNNAVHRKGYYEAKFNLTPLRPIGTLGSALLPYVLTIANFDSFRVIDRFTEEVLMEKSLGRTPGVDDATVKTLGLELPSSALATPSLRTLTVQAFRDGVQYVQTHRMLKVYPKGKASSYPLVWDLQTFPQSDFAAIYTIGNPANGWRLLDGALVIGDGTGYVDNLDTSAVLILSVPTGAVRMSVRLTSQVHSEANRDFFTCFIFDPTTEQPISEFFNFAGIGSASGTRYAPVSGRSVVGLNLRFTSDISNADGFGVKIKYLLVSFA
ncbi:hypothetical protein BJ742DRAFT_846711 [Cladochytrium replicatum]|nr:hypothetical protein BJ742DRAFT_846711 [Cladochytrium replicatum]